MELSIFIFFIIAGILLIVAFFWRKSREERISRYRPRKRHLITRMICGTIGTIILVVLGIATWNDVTNTYSSPIDQTFKVPTEEPPSFPDKPSIPEEEETIDALFPARFLVHSVLIDRDRGLRHPLDIRHFTFEWEENDQSYRTFSYSIDRISSVIELKIGEPKYDSHRKKFLLGYNIAIAFPRGRRITSSMFQFGENSISSTHEAIRNERIQNFPGGLSLTFSADHSLSMIWLVTRIAPDDPLKKGDLHDFLHYYQDPIQEDLNEYEHLFGQFNQQKKREIHIMSLSSQLGWFPVLLLLATAILYTQFFVRRPLAFVGMLALMILFVVAADFTVQTYHLNKLENENASLSTRMTACEHVSTSFFYQNRAREKLKSVSRNASNPERLRTFARLNAGIDDDNNQN